MRRIGAFGVLANDNRQMAKAAGNSYSPRLRPPRPSSTLPRDEDVTGLSVAGGLGFNIDHAGSAAYRGKPVHHHFAACVLIALSSICSVPGASAKTGPVDPVAVQGATFKAWVSMADVMDDGRTAPCRRGSGP